MSRIRNRRPTPQRQTFLLEEGVFAGAAPGHPADTRPVGSLTEYLQAILNRGIAETALHPDVLDEAGALAARTAELRFCTRELIPQLRALSGAAPVEPLGLVDDVVEAGLALEQAVLARLRDLPLAEELAGRLGLPCTLIGQAVIPLLEEPEYQGAGLVVHLNGVRYVYCFERTASFATFRRQAEHILLRVLRHMITDDEELHGQLSRFWVLQGSLLDALAPERGPVYTVLYSDDEYQLQFSRGAWVLVRGPLPKRVGEGAAFVGLEIRGRSRGDWLSKNPGAARALDAFWQSRGVPRPMGMCMGADEQYEHLLDERFSDAEAVVRWLDAGVDLATGRSEFHRRWRLNETGAEEDPDESPF